jgi:hypothetical protein
MKFLFLIVCMFMLIGFGSAVISTPSVCCEKSLSGGICLNLPEGQCDSSAQMASTSCEATSFCRLGTCFDSKEGICMENVPQKVCTERGGAWSEKKAFELPQCQLGCCIISDQAAFVPLVRCKKLSSNFGIEMDYRSSVTSETECIALANDQDQGACVTYTATGVNSCKFSTRGECGALDGVIALNVNRSELEIETGKKFFHNMLCSAEELNTECARQVKTDCYQGKVYWFDSCGNRENVYSSDKDASWNRGRVASPDEICARTSGSRDCGNCDYLLGSRCDEWSGILGIGKPAYGDYFCKKTTCTDMDGKTRLNGESWCVYDIEPGRGYELVGSRHFRQICIDGNVVTDPCKDFRNDICIHSGIPTSQGEFSTAACRVNRYQDCASITRKRDCENVDVRDCIWVEKPEGMNFATGGQGGSLSNPLAGQELQNPSAGGTTAGDVIQGVQEVAPLFTGGGSGNMNPGQTALSFSLISGMAISPQISSSRGMWEIDYDILNKVSKFNKTEVEEGGLCVPMIPPGSKFWEGQDSCSMASATCEVVIKVTEKMDILTKKSYDYDTYYPNGTHMKDLNVQSECLEWVSRDKNKRSYSLVPKPEWAKKVNAICTSVGDCGANFNINQKYTDDGYLWKYKNDTFSLRSNVQRGLSPISGNVVADVSSGFLINDEIKLGEDSYVLVKK